MICVWAAPPTCMSRGLRAYRGVDAHTQGLTCERTMWLSGRYHPGQAPDNAREQPIPPRTAHNADHFATSSPLSAFFTEVVCDVGATPPRTSAAPAANRREFRYTSFRSSRDSPRAGRQSEGISLHELLTRRRHAARGLRVAKNPITSPARGAAASTTARLRHERTASRHDTRGEHQARLQGTPNQNCKQRSGPPRTPNRLTAHAAAYHLAG